MRPVPVLLLALLVSGCGAAEPATAPDGEASELRESIQAPLDKAKEVEATQAAEEAERQKALDEAGG
jgi:hypothetical protein